MPQIDKSLRTAIEIKEIENGQYFYGADNLLTKKRAMEFPKKEF